MKNKIRTVDIPQANSLSKVGDIVALTDAGMHGNKALSSHLQIDPREVEYYRHAARIVGLLSPEKKPSVTPIGARYLAAKTPNQKLAVLSEAVRDSPIFKALLEHSTDPELNKGSIINFLKENTTLTGTTVGRRASTLVAWLKTISEFDPEDFVSLARRASADSPALFSSYAHRGEGPLHKQLKEPIRDNPRDLLGEHLTLVQEEYQFPTNDRIDLLFADARARYLAVEVEIDVGPKDVVGLLQAVKYRALLTVQFGRAEKDVFGLLAARSIHRYMQERAARYAIRTREISGII
ncbi:endonuclease NucS [Acidobacteriia bacterium AH_259_A11_L15]|nr:endonuclease NucS [Acidobacteriia bacterium AH_259_A11_L15]